MDGQEKLHSRGASPPRDSVRMEITEDENWTNVQTVYTNGPITHSSELSKDATTSYSTNREKVFHKNAGTIEETHVLESSGRATKDYSEEHWSSEIKSYVTPQPPKFIQVIKAFRVLATDTLTLVVEVHSEPPAIFEWFCNDRPVQQDRRRFKARHGINITTLTVEGPEQGVYKCTARNPAGVSTTYGYVTVNAPPSYRTWLEQKHEVIEEMKSETVDKENIRVTVDVPPKFIHQIPNLTLRPGTEAVIDVQVEASPPAKFSWYVNGVEFRDSFGQIEVYYPMANRCVARFPIPQTGEYKVVAENRAGKDQSIGYIDIKKEVMYHQTQLPPLPSDHMYHRSTYTGTEHRGSPFLPGRGRASSVTRTVDVYEESSYYQRSTSLPRQSDRPYEIKKTTEIIRKRKDDWDQLQQQQQQLQYSSLKQLVETEEDHLNMVKRRRRSEITRPLPQAPVFIEKLPKETKIISNEDLVLSVGIKATPRADVKWNVNGFELKDSKNVTVIDEEDHSTLIVHPPVRYGRYSITAVNQYGMNTQATQVHCDEEEQYRQIDEETIVRQTLSLPPEFVENAMAVSSSNTEWEFLEEQQRSSRSADSFETVKHVEPPVRELAEGTVTPVPSRTTEQRYEDLSGEIAYKAAPTTIIEPSPLLTSISTEERYEETIDVSRELARAPAVPPKPVTPIIHEPLTAALYTGERYTATVSTTGETPIQQLPPPKPAPPPIEVSEFEHVERRSFRIPVHRTTEPLPKRPFVLKQPEPEIRLKAGEKLVLESKVDSFPESQFKWYQNNFEVRPSPQVIIESPAVNESRVTFTKPVSGSYKMVATNVHGSCSSTTRVVVEVTEEWVLESSTAVLRTLPEKQGPKYQLVKRSRVEARSDLPKAPRIAESFAPLLKVSQDEPLVLNVVADAIPEAEFRWLLNNFEVRASQMVAVERLGRNVSQATFYAPISGRYEVIAVNSLGQDSRSTKVIVETVPQPQAASTQRISRPALPRVPVFIKALPGETQLNTSENEFHLSVLVHGEQPITFRWFADGSLLSNSVEHQMINEQDGSTLLVRRPVAFDVDYAVEVSNANGAVWSETTVKPASPATSLISAAAAPVVTIAEDAQHRSPRFASTLTDLILNQNDQFTAQVSIYPECSPCEFLWTLSGRDIRTVPGFRVQSTFYESTLFVRSASPKHSGELSVSATNKYGTARSTAKITVQQLREESFEIVPEARTIPAERAPVFVSPLQASVFQAGEPLKLHCRVDGLPRPEVIWTKDEIRIDEWVMEKEIIIRHYPDGFCELINPEATVEDSGLYQVIARNIHGTTSTSAYILVETTETTTTVEETEGEVQVIHRVPSRPRFSEILSKQYEHETVVTCRVTSDTPVQVTWYKDGQRLSQTYKYRMQTLLDNTHMLQICNIDKWDEGLYVCRAENESGSTETSIYIRPPTETHEVKEELLVEESTNEVVGLRENIDYLKKEYTDTTVKIIAEPEVSGSQEIYSHTAELRKSEEEYKLLVKVAEIVASKLVAKVVIDEAIRMALKRINVEVHSSEEEEFESTTEQPPSPPRFATNIECYTVDVGDTVVLRTDIGGYPQPRIEWYFGEQKLELSEQINAEYVSGRATLTIKKVGKKHEGTYHCYAENDYGKATLSCILRVIETAHARAESTHEMIRPPLTYTLSETEAEVSSNVHVSHAIESYEHHFAVLQPETIALGYSCLASTSKVHDDSVIIRREAIRRQLEESQAYATLNVNVERAPAHFTHDARIIQSAGERAAILQFEPKYRRTEEVIQANDIQLIQRQRTLRQQQSTVNAITTVVLEKPSQRALHEVTCLYDEKAQVTIGKVQAVGTVNLKEVEMINELITTVMATKEEHKAYAIANVDVRQPDALFDHVITIVESERERLKIDLIAPMLTKRFTSIDVHFQRKQQSLETETVRLYYPRRHATAEQRIVILESLQQKFSEAITWSLKKIHKEALEGDIVIAQANVEVHKPGEIGEHTTTIVDTARIVPELLAIAAAASKLKITSVFVTFTKKGDVAHQALVIEYESFVEDEATLNVAMLTAPGFHSKQEDVWSRGRKYEKIEQTETNVVAVFVEVDAICPDQTVELVASVSLPPSGLIDVTRSAQSLLEASSVSCSESSSIGLFQAPRFIKTLENATATIGQCHQFKCIVSGAPAPHIRWFVDGDMIHDSDVYQTVYEDGVCILKIREIAIEDEGEYICEATNDAGRAITKCFLRTITETGVSDYQQAIYENDNDLASWDNSNGSLSSTNGRMYRTATASWGSLQESDNSTQELNAVVEYEFVQMEPSTAETIAIVTRYITPQKGLRKNFASEERSFNISVSLPDATMDCDFIWNCSVSEYLALQLMSPISQSTDCAIQISRPHQAEEARFLLSANVLTYESISLAICQPWEELLLLKRPENAFVSDSEFSRIQRIQLPFFAKIHDNSNEINQLVKCSSLSNEYDRNSSQCCVDAVVEMIDPLVSTDLVIFENESPIQIKGTYIAAETHKEQFEQYKMESQITILPQKIDDCDNVLENETIADESNLDLELLRRTAEIYPNINTSNLAAILRYVDALLDFTPALAFNAEREREANIEQVTTVSDEVSGNFTAVEYLKRSFERRMEHAEAVLSRCLPIFAIESLTVRDSAQEGLESKTTHITRHQESTDGGDVAQNDVNSDSHRNERAQNEQNDYFERQESKIAKDDPSEQLNHRAFSIPLFQPAESTLITSNPKAESLSSELFADKNNSKGRVLRSNEEEEVTSHTESVETEIKTWDEEALQIERAIFDVSEELERQQPITEAQAEANEELLKTMLEDIIINSGSSTIKETMVAYKKPIALLREKFTDLEKTLMTEDSAEQLGVTSLESANINGIESKSDERGSVEREILMTSTSGQQTAHCLGKEAIGKGEVARMTPLASNIKEQLQKIENMLGEVEQRGESDNEVTSRSGTAILIPDSKHHEVHHILMQINNEISIIKRYCHRNISRKSVDAAIGLLHKVRNNVSSMVDLLSVNRSRFRKKSPEKLQKMSAGRMKSPKRTAKPLSPLSKTGFFFKTDASVNFYIVKPEEVEIINAIVMLRSASDKSGNQTLRSDNSEMSAYEDALTRVYDDESASVQITKCHSVPQAPIFERTSDGKQRLCSSMIAGVQSSSLLKATKIDEMLSSPVPPPRRRKEMKADSPSPIPPPRPKHVRSKSFDSDKQGSELHCSTACRPDYPSRSQPNVITDSCKKQRQFVQSDNPIMDSLSELTDSVVLEEPDLVTMSIAEGRSGTFDEKINNFEAVISKKEDCFCCSDIWPTKAKYRISMDTFDESSSVQLVCEDSDYAPDKDTQSVLLFATVQRNAQDSEENLMQQLALLPILNKSGCDDVEQLPAKSLTKAGATPVDEEQYSDPELHIDCTETAIEYPGNEQFSGNLELIQNLKNSTSEFIHSKSAEEPTANLHACPGTMLQRSPLMNPSEDDTSSLNEVESIDDKDETFDEIENAMVICNPHVSVIDSVDVLPTIMEGSESSKTASSFMSVSTSTTVTAGGMLRNVSQDTLGSDMQRTATKEVPENETQSAELTAIADNYNNDDEVNYREEYKKRVIVIRESESESDPEETTLNVAYKRCSSKLKVLAVLSPEIWARAESSAIVGEDFDVLIEQPDEVQNFTIKILDQINDSISFDLVLPSIIDVDLSLAQDEQCEGVLSYQHAKNLISGETDDDQLSFSSNQQYLYDADSCSERCTGVSVTIIARSMHDVARASLEEIAWGEVSMHVLMQPDMIRSVSDSEAKSSLIQNVTVSESNETEKRSLRSHESFRSSQYSFDLSEFEDCYDSWQNLSVPSYVIKEGSTATITCEFNNFLNPGSIIDWFKGKSVVPIVPGKIDRISHDLLEVLVISQMDTADGDIYSIRVNDVVYPVACLTVEDADSASLKIDEDLRFLSPPQTLFVMEGQPSIISCQVNIADQKVEWCKDNKKWVTENERIRLEADQFGYHRIIIDKSELEDQGTYYAFLGDHFTTVTLVVEERIDEREVTVNASGTESDEDDYREYLVPAGSTATIACELENSDEIRELVWRKDGARIEFMDDAKMEHVVNGLKHYLVIHDTQADDSACYSVCINDIEFKIAHMIVSDYATTIGSKHTKRISSNSLHHYNH